MRKIFSLSVTPFAFFLLYLLNVSSASADSCELYIDNQLPEYSSNYNHAITLKNKSGCFNNIPYLIVAYPQSIESTPSRYSNYPSDEITPKDNSTLNFTLDLVTKSVGVRNPGIWTIKVCIGPSLQDCGNKDNVLGRIINIKIGSPLPTPTPTPKPGFPIIDPIKQGQCTFTPGSSVNLKIDNTGQLISYVWYWRGDNPNDNRIAQLDQKLSVTTLTIPPQETIQSGKRTFCIFKRGQHYNEFVTPQNCILLNFTLDSDELKNTSCSLLNTGVVSIFASAPTPTPSPKSPLPPCAKWGDRNGTPYTEEQLNQGFKDKDGNLKIKENQLKCLAVNTAIGEISTQPQGFVRRVFSLVLGIAGGIALILIIISGYRMMASQGNPEALTAARDQLISAIVGLLFIILSFVILQVIGVDILKIPGFKP